MLLDSTVAGIFECFEPRFSYKILLRQNIPVIRKHCNHCLKNSKSLTVDLSLSYVTSLSVFIFDTLLGQGMSNPAIPREYLLNPASRQKFSIQLIFIS